MGKNMCSLNLDLLKGSILLLGRCFMEAAGMLCCEPGSPSQNLSRANKYEKHLKLEELCEQFSDWLKNEDHCLYLEATSHVTYKTDHPAIYIHFHALYSASAAEDGREEKECITERL